MFVCVCLAVTDTEVEAAIASGAASREAVTRACRAGGDCGACHGMIEQMVEDHEEKRRPSRGCPASGPGLISAEHLSAGGRAA